MKKQKRKIPEIAVLSILMGWMCMVTACTGETKGNELLLLAEQEGAGVLQTGAREMPNGAEALQETRESLGDAAEIRDKEKTVFVYICGEVVNPGVYEVAEGSRIYEVLQLAGGFREEADREYLNLAASVTDGMQIIVLSEEEAETEKERSLGKTGGLVNINTASAEELCTLPGIGQSRAEDIIAYRSENGAFETPEDIMQVSGIKSALYEKLKDKICVE